MKKIIILSVLSLVLGPISYMANAMTAPSADIAPEATAAVDVALPDIINLCPPNFCPSVPNETVIPAPTPAPHPCTPSLFADAAAIPCVVDPTVVGPAHETVVGPCDVINPNIPQVAVDAEADAVAPCAVDPIISPPHPCTPSLFVDRASLPCIPAPIHDAAIIGPCDVINPNIPQVAVDAEADAVAPCAVDPIEEEEQNEDPNDPVTPSPSGGGGGGFIPTNVTSTPPTPPTSPANGDNDNQDQQVLGEQVFASNSSDTGDNQDQQVLGEQVVAGDQSTPSFPKTGNGTTPLALSVVFLTSLLTGAFILSRKQKESSVFSR